MREPFVEKTAQYLWIEQWNQLDESVHAGFTTRRDGYSMEPFKSLNVGLHVKDNSNHVVKNRESFASTVNTKLEDWVFSEQVHDSNVALVTNEDKSSGIHHLESSIPKVDGLLTKERGLVCTQLYADCVPLFFFDPVTKYIGIAHAGWQGTVKEIAKKMVQRFVEKGITPDSIRVAIGPCIQKSNYKVNDQVINSVKTEDLKHVTKQIGQGQYLLDLPLLNERVLLRSGINKKNIIKSQYCTFENEDLFFSHRRDSGSTGRMLGFIMIC